MSQPTTTLSAAALANYIVALSDALREAAAIALEAAETAAAEAEADLTDDDPRDRLSGYAREEALDHADACVAAKVTAQQAYDACVAAMDAAERAEAAVAAVSTVTEPHVALAASPVTVYAVESVTA